ncbi:MAG: 50S ribosomal protein L3 [Saccharolobus sp.]|uniref:Large ribosomal subunit protein uL3 n=2 Tax=Saccharolobus shibatae TaxID=2286 RepID=A0A8F5C2Z1_9CREN|nr:50S ribosomal protein L3 [Saccharolobus shibatae]MCH4814928.1 50S ribosomal protein L3 [Saccharolobus shibatae]QXJ29805.1 LSU ribosomal protein L3e (L3p) [Saccharolobus shibatae B12]QXJ33041.1 LSU ribosomal protein L3e (L3p) [Saccharolobus shibatae]QXJ36159.1 LSU ribosomal protein L3e (L3p) [Saccharolobus shibatae]
MGHRKLASPRRGSAGLRPRKRSSELLPTPRTWPQINSPNPKLLGFVGYKVGMSHVFMIDDWPNSPTNGKEIYMPVTVLEVPPIIPLALRAYAVDGKGEPNVITEYWSPSSLQFLDITRRIHSLSSFLKNDESKKKFEENFGSKLDLIKSNLDRIVYFRLLVATQPRKIPSLGKKVPDLVEIQIGGGEKKAQLDYALNVLGKEISIKDVFKEGQLIDVIGVTKGKGFAGVIKRYSVVELPRWHKHRKGSRKIGTRGPSLGTPSYTPQPGQLGFHRRTEYNKRIIKIGDDPKEINPAGGFVRYGIVRNTYILLEGSILGSKKRPIFLREAVRPSYVFENAPKITYVNLLSQQG